MKEKFKRKGFWKRVGATILAALCLVTTITYIAQKKRGIKPRFNTYRVVR